MEVAKAVILTAIPSEYVAVKKHIKSPIEKIHPKGNVYEEGIFKGIFHDWTIGLAEVGAGNNTCALETERAINYFKPNVIIFVGVAGGIKDLKLGDVVAAEKAYGYEFGKVSSIGFLARPEVGKSTYAILSRARAEAKKTDWLKRIYEKDSIDVSPNVIVKPIAAGEKVIAETKSQLYGFLKKHYNDTVAVEMEGSGFFTACQANEGIQSLIIRGISDLLNNKEESDKSGSQEKAARNASAFAFEVLSKLKIF